MNSNNPIRLIWLILAVLGVLLIASSLIQEVFTERMKWSEVKSLVASGQVSEVIIDGEEVTLTYRNAKDTLLTATGVYIPEDKAFLPLLEANNVIYSSKPTSAWWLIVKALVVLLLICMGFSLIFQNQQNGMAGANMRKTKAMLADETESTTRFSDVAGVDDALEELEEF